MKKEIFCYFGTGLLTITLCHQIYKIFKNKKVDGISYYFYIY